MPLRDLEYRARLLVRLDEYLAELGAQKTRADRIAQVRVATRAEAMHEAHRPRTRFGGSRTGRAQRPGRATHRLGARSAGRRPAPLEPPRRRGYPLAPVTRFPDAPWTNATTPER